MYGPLTEDKSLGVERVDWRALDNHPVTNVNIKDSTVPYRRGYANARQN